MATGGPERCNWGIRRYSPRDFDGRPDSWTRRGHATPVTGFEELMLISPAYAQSPFGGGSTDMITSLLPFVLIFVIMYFLILRPQQKRVKQHAEMVKNVRKGDTVITSGGLVGRVTKVVDDDQVEIEVADGVRVRQMRSMVSDVRAKGEPVKDDETKS
jgi:preprotein translocase subunit YajC